MIGESMCATTDDPIALEFTADAAGVPTGEVINDTLGGCGVLPIPGASIPIGTNVVTQDVSISPVLGAAVCSKTI